MDKKNYTEFYSKALRYEIRFCTNGYLKSITDALFS